MNTFDKTNIWCS